VKGIALLEAGEIPLKGKSRPTKIYTIVGDETVAASSEFAAWSRQHDVLLAAIQAGHAGEAATALASCRELAGEDMQDFYLHFSDQIAVLDKASPQQPVMAEKLAHQ
jgi:adenylate cyclase